MKKRTIIFVALLGSAIFSITACSKNEVVYEKGSNKTSENSSTIIATEKLTAKGASSEMLKDTMDSFSKVQQFGVELLKENQDTNNPVISPVSAYLALAMTGIGSDGDTLEEFKTVLGEKMEIASRDMMNKFPCEEKGLTLNLANSIWANNTFTPKEQWLQKTADYFQGEVYRGDLSTIEVVDDINSWVNKNTKGLIKEMIEEPLNEQTQLVLFNSLYFKGKWKNPFDGNITRKSDFTISNDEKVQVDMMNSWQASYDYIVDEKVEGVILPYVGDKLEFVALKTKNNKDIREVLKDFSGKQLEQLMKSREENRVNLMLPKFQVMYDKELNESLKTLGIQKAFQRGEADFSKMGSTQTKDSLYISLVRQKSYIVVDEEGTEAAAVTEVEVKAESAMLEEKAKDMFYNEPFMYMILDKSTNVPLFMGIMDKP